MSRIAAGHVIESEVGLKKIKGGGGAHASLAFDLVTRREVAR